MDDEYEFENLFHIAYIAKRFYDCGKWEQFCKAAEGFLDCYDEYYSFAQLVMGCVTEFVGDYENCGGDDASYEDDTFTYYFCDPVIQNYFLLCEAYERQSGISPEENPYRQLTGSDFRRCFGNIESFFCFLIRDKTHKLKGSGIVIIYDGEFYDFHGLLLAMLDMLDCFKKRTAEIERRLSAPVPHKEAA